MPGPVQVTDTIVIDWAPKFQCWKVYEWQVEEDHPKGGRYIPEANPEGQHLGFKTLEEAVAYTNTMRTR